MLSDLGLKTNWESNTTEGTTGLAAASGGGARRRPLRPARRQQARLGFWKSLFLHKYEESKSLSWSLDCSDVQLQCW